MDKTMNKRSDKETKEAIVAIKKERDYLQESVADEDTLYWFLMP